MEKRLYRNEHDKVIAGVASGLAEYMQVDVAIVRILFVLSIFFLAGAGLLVYIVIWIAVPINNDLTAKYKQFNDYFQKNQPDHTIFNNPNAFSNPSNANTQTKWNTENSGLGFDQLNDSAQSKRGNDTSRTIGGLILLFLGLYFLLRQFDMIPYWFNIFKIYKLWPLAIIAVGVSLILKNKRKNEWDDFKKSTEEAQKSAQENSVETPTHVGQDKAE